LEDLNDLSICSGFEFKSFSDRGFSVVDYDYVAQAYHIYTELNGFRSSVEGYLLCPDLSYADIAHNMDIEVGVIDAYADLFFDVRPRLQNVGWICTVLFGDLLGLHRDSESASKIGQNHRAGWLMGGHGVKMYTEPNPTPATATAFRAYLAENVLDVAYRQTLLGQFCRARSDERGLETVRIAVADIKQKALEAIGASAEGDHGEAIMEFLKSVPFSVADPSLEVNKCLPAREERVHEMILAADAVGA
jgi:hypothetical protein